jgi:hypothetical protein
MLRTIGMGMIQFKLWQRGIPGHKGGESVGGVPVTATAGVRFQCREPNGHGPVCGDAVWHGVSKQ